MKKNDKDLSHLYTAIGTMVFMIAGMPILESISTWVSNVFGLQSIKLQAEANKYNRESQDEGCDTHVIGFQIPSEEDNEEIEDE